MRNSSPALHALIREAETTAASEPSTLDILAAALNVVIPSAADPYLVLAALIEGAAETVVRKIPAARQGDVAVGVVRLLRDRLSTRGAI